MEQYSRAPVTGSSHHDESYEWSTSASPNASRSTDDRSSIVISISLLDADSIPRDHSRSACRSSVGPGDVDPDLCPNLGGGYFHGAILIACLSPTPISRRWLPAWCNESPRSRGSRLSRSAVAERDVTIFPTPISISAPTTEASSIELPSLKSPTDTATAGSNSRRSVARDRG